MSSVQRVRITAGIEQQFDFQRIPDKRTSRDSLLLQNRQVPFLHVVPNYDRMPLQSITECLQLFLPVIGSGINLGTKGKLTDLLAVRLKIK